MFIYIIARDEYLHPKKTKHNILLKKGTIDTFPYLYV